MNLYFHNILKNNYGELLFQIQWYNKKCTLLTVLKNVSFCETDGQSKC